MKRKLSHVDARGEASMVDVLLMDALVAALPAHATLLLVGDQDQLASVEAGDVLGAICRVAHDAGDGDALHDSVLRLTRSYRFEAHPAIGDAAAMGDARHPVGQQHGRAPQHQQATLRSSDRHRSCR